MAVPSLITDLSTTAASNPPGGAENPFPDLDNHIRAAYAFIAQNYASIQAKAPIASPTFTGTATSPKYAIDANYYLNLASGNPILQFDSGDQFGYDRTSNRLVSLIGGTERFAVTANGPERQDDASTANGLVRKSQMDTAVSGVATPSGAVMAFARTTAPTGWLKCDGSAVSRSTYAALFAEVGTAFGAGDGSSTFNLPDLRGEFIRGFDDGRGIDAGRAFASVQSSNNKAHDHMVFADADSGGNYTTGTNYAGRWAPGNDNNVRTNQIGVNTPPSIGLTSQSGGSESRPRNVALLYCIKT